MNTKRLDTSPPGLGSDSDNLPTAAARAAELVNGSHLASTLSTVQGPRILPNLPQASRAAPRPPVSSNRSAPPTTGSSTLPSMKAEMTPLPADLRLRTKAQGPQGSATTITRNDTSQSEQARQIQEQQERQDQLWEQEQKRKQQEQRQQQREQERQQQQQERQQQQQERQHQQQSQRAQDFSRPPPPKSSPATSTPVTHPAGGPAGSTTGPPPVLPLQPAKKVHIQNQEKPTKPAGGQNAAAGNGSVAAAAAALEKPKEKRISTMTEVQIMEKLRQVVSADDPKLLYSKIRKVGQGCVVFCRRSYPSALISSIL